MASKKKKSVAKSKTYSPAGEFFTLAAQFFSEDARQHAPGSVREVNANRVAVAAARCAKDAGGYGGPSLQRERVGVRKENQKRVKPSEKPRSSMSTTVETPDIDGDTPDTGDE